jgi:membrane protease subunit (stomatin/prohibitin family)
LLVCLFGQPPPFITKLVGTIREFNQVNLTSAFHGILMTKIKDYIANQFIKEKITFLEIHAHIDGISKVIKENLATEFNTYGIRLVNFNVNSISVPENDPSYNQLKAALARKAEMGILGYNYQQERTFDVLEGAVKNEGGGAGIMGAGVGLGMGVNLRSVIGTAFGGAITNIDVKAAGEKEGKVCKKCGAGLLQNAKFCPECGERATDDGIMICPNCKEPTPQGKFCLHCGHRLSCACPKYGAELTAQARFCPECGERLGI